jgi:hypothetical protein
MQIFIYIKFKNRKNSERVRTPLAVVSWEEKVAMAGRQAQRRALGSKSTLPLNLGVGGMGVSHL